MALHSCLRFHLPQFCGLDALGQLCSTARGWAWQTKRAIAKAVMQTKIDIDQLCMRHHQDYPPFQRVQFLVQRNINCDLMDRGVWTEVYIQVQGVGSRSHEKPGRAKMGQDEPNRREEARRSHGEPGGGQGEFWRVLLGLGARRWRGGAMKSQEGLGWARMGPRGAGKPGRARGAMASSGEFCWDLEPGGGQKDPEEPGRDKMGQDEHKNRE